MLNSNLFDSHSKSVKGAIKVAGAQEYGTTKGRAERALGK